MMKKYLSAPPISMTAAYSGPEILRLPLLLRMKRRLKLRPTTIQRRGLSANLPIISEFNFLWSILASKDKKFRIISMRILGGRWWSTLIKISKFIEKCSEYIPTTPFELLKIYSKSRKGQT